MVRIETSTDINSSTDRVWQIISDLDAEPKFWKGTKHVRNILNDGNKIVREMVIAFRDQKCLQHVTMKPKTEIHAVFVRGIIKGTKTILLKPGTKSTILHVVWDVKLGGIMGPFTGMIKRHIESGTQNAIASIKREAER